MKTSFYAIIIVLAGTIGYSVPLIAGHPEHHGVFDKGGESADKTCPHKKKGHGHLTKKLGLNDSQRAQFEEVMKAQRAKRQELIDASGIKNSLKDLHGETVQKLSKVLDAEQLEKFETYHAKRSSHKCGKHCKHKSGEYHKKCDH